MNKQNNNPIEIKFVFLFPKLCVVGRSVWSNDGKGDGNTITICFSAVRATSNQELLNSISDSIWFLLHETFFVFSFGYIAIR